MTVPRLLTKTFALRYRELDRSGRVKLAALFDWMQEVAADHAEKLGFGYRALADTGLGWALSRIRLEVETLPQIGDEVTLTTYPSGIQRILAMREYRFSCRGQEIGRATSAWLALDMTKQKIVRPETLPGTFPDNCDLPVAFELAGKLPRVETPRCFEVPLRYTMEDVNGHLNNAEYANFVEDAAVLLKARPAAPFEVEMDFLSACRAPETVSVCAGTVDETRFSVSGFHADGTPAFNALLTGYRKHDHHN